MARKPREYVLRRVGGNQHDAGVQSFDVEDDRHWKANVVIPLGLGGLKSHAAART